ncbi:sigma 54-interacting transcriptional regulator [Clostridium hydrogenum]|uniref:sigma 54-interacting transcriptional regulator n=1 Tax=Clostridium hydrogenum TaxID=2855764 RepID=UPI001F3B9BAB|nr:sigma 54-interacting transcriptional regulator [Clostridium hydrogenum]
MPINIALITQNETLSNLFPIVAKERGFNSIIKPASFTKARKIALKLENEVDAIISRGATGELIKKVANIPAVSIPITSMDVFRAIYRAKQVSDNIALVFYKESRLNKLEVENMLNVKLTEFQFDTEYEINNVIAKVKQNNFKVIVGGMASTDVAIANGLIGITVETGEEALRQAVDEALSLIEVRRTELSRSARFKAILDSIGEGIIVTDQHKKIITSNPSANKMFNKTTKEILDKNIHCIIPNYKIDSILKSGKTETKVIKNLHGLTIAASRLPIKVEGKIIGVVNTFEDVTKIQTLEQMIRKKIHEKGFVARYHFEDILTQNERMKELKKLAFLYSKTDSSILIQGESGTGKELFAQSIHNSSNRKNGPFVAINCAALPEQLLESELFGYEGGSFTGAKKEGKQGLFELAHNGTIFLDEIGELSKPLQARLLRVLEEKEIMHIGGDKIIPVNIRIISATNEHLSTHIEKRTFRKDLYYRLNVFNIKLPPLRDRNEDIELLATHFLEALNTINVDYDAVLKNLTPILITYNWPGNVRELSNIMERVSLFIKNNEPIKWEKILQTVINNDEGKYTIKLNISNFGTLKDIINDVEKQIIKETVIRCDNDHGKAAERLGIGRTTLWRKMST